MPIKSIASRILPPLLVGTAAVGWLAGCASERTQAAAPTTVNLSGEWALNLNLSDDPDRPADTQKAPALTPGDGRPRGGLGRPGGGGPGMGGPGGDLSPMGTPDMGPNFTGVRGAGIAENLAQNATQGASFQSAGANEDALSAGGWAGTAPSGVLASGLEQPPPLPPANAPAGDASPPTTRKAAVNRLLAAPPRLSIVQKGTTVVVKRTFPDGTSASDEYTAGTQTTVQLGPEDTGECQAGWRGPVFVVTTKARKSGWREDDYALDEDGRLIVSIQTRGGRVGKFDFKRVYDRLKE